MRVRFEPCVAHGIVSAPPSKSMAHRLLIAAGLATGESTVRGVAYSEDILATLDCLAAIGAGVRCEGDTVFVRGVGGTPHPKANYPLACRESGSTLRFFIPLCLLSGDEATLCGSERLLSRPLGVYEDICRAQGLTFSRTKGGIRVAGRLSAGEYRVAGNISSQFISGLLFALPQLEGDSEICLIPPVESRSYLYLTLAALEKAGVHAAFSDDTHIAVRGGQSYTAFDATVEGDASNAAFLAAFSLLGGNVCIEGLPEHSLQGDSVFKEYFQQLKEGTPTLSLAECPDLAPILFAMAAVLHGGVFEHTARLAMKESDRARAMAEELCRCGGCVLVEEDRVVVKKTPLSRPVTPLFGHNDHRVVMALSVLLSHIGGEIDGAEAVAKSFPDFFSRIKELGVRCYDESSAME